jgi:hypothetical protein
MNSTQLRKAVRGDVKTSQIFDEVYPSDKLPKKLVAQLPYALISNLDPSDKPGSHWIAIYIDPDGWGEYFDSYGQPPLLKEHKDFLKRNCGHHFWDYNPTNVQNPLSATCGQHCLFYLCLRVRDIPLRKILTQYYGRNRNKIENDTAVINFVKKNFSLDTRLIDSEGLVNQIATALG